MPPIRLKTIINTNNNAEIPDRIPLDVSNMINNINIENRSEQINPEIIPRKFNNLFPIKPQMKAPDKTEITKYRPINFDTSGDFDNIYENIIDKSNDTATPIKEDIIMPNIVLIGAFNSIRFLIIFLPIKNPSHSIKNMRESLFL